MITFKQIIQTAKRNWRNKSDFVTKPVLFISFKRRLRLYKILPSSESRRNVYKSDHKNKSQQSNREQRKKYGCLLLSQGAYMRIAEQLFHSRIKRFSDHEYKYVRVWPDVA